MKLKILFWILIPVAIFVISPMFSIFGIFLAFYFERERISLQLEKINLNLKIKFILIGILFGMLTEILAIIDNLKKLPEDRILFHPDPAVDLLMGFGFYTSIFIIWWLLFKRFQFKVRDVFVVGGFWGITAEQTGAIFSSISQPISMHLD